MARGSPCTKLSLSSVLLLSFLACALCYCSFLFVVFCFVFVLFYFCFVSFSSSPWSFVDVPLYFSCPADHVPDWQPRIYITGYGLLIHPRQREGMIVLEILYKGHIINRAASGET